MNDKDFESIWRSSMGPDLVNIDQHSFLHDLTSKMNKIDRTIKKRNIREKVIAVLMIIAFCSIAYIIPYTLTKIASLLMVPYYLLYMYKIDRVRNHKSCEVSQPPKQFLLNQREYIRKEKNLLDTVLYWAILPLLPILVLFYSGFPMDYQSYLWSAGITLAILLVVYGANKYTAKNTFAPLLNNLDTIIREFNEKEQPSD